MPWTNQAVSLIVIQERPGVSGLFIYLGEPALGNPPVAYFTSSTRDPAGNEVTPALGLDGLPLLAYGLLASGGNVVQLLSGSGNWTAPPGVTSVKAECWGGGGGGGAAGADGGGGGGEYASQTVAVTPGGNYPFSVAAGGAGAAGAGNGSPGSASAFSGDTQTVTANGGAGGGTVGGPGGTGSTNTVNFDGGAGGIKNPVTGAAGGGGSSAGILSAGNPGGTSGGAAVTGGGAGGAGNNAGAGGAGSLPGGGGGGGSTAGGAGAAGQIRLTYNTSATASGLLASLSSQAGIDALGQDYPPGWTLGRAEAWILPSGDQSGETDAANINGAFANGFKTVHLLPGIFYTDAGLTVGLGQYLGGPGWSAAVLKYVGTAPATVLTAVNTGAYSATQFASAKGFTIDLSGAPDGCTALQAGDIVQLDIDLAILDGNAAHVASKAALFLNQLYQTEQMRARLYIEGSGITAPVTFSKSGTGTVSFDRDDIDIYFGGGVNIPAGGAAILWENGAQQGGGSLRVAGNIGGTAASAGTIFGLGTNSVLDQIRLEVNLEFDGTGTAPSTWNFATGTHLRGYGIQTFTRFNPSNLTVSIGQMFFEGPIQGDDTLSNALYLGATAFLRTITANGQTIFGANAAATNIQVTSSAAFTGLIMQPGVFDGQLLVLANVGTGSLTMAAAATSHVSNGTSCVLQPGTCQVLVWIGSQSLWYPQFV